MYFNFFVYKAIAAGFILVPGGGFHLSFSSFSVSSGVI